MTPQEPDGVSNFYPHAGLGQELRAITGCPRELSKSRCRNSSKEDCKTVREGDADYGDCVEEIVRMWLMEDLDAVASVCGVDPQEMFGDVLALIVSESPHFHMTDPEYAECVRQLLGWFAEDIGSVARSFGLDPVDVFEDLLKVIISDTPLADHIVERMEFAPHRDPQQNANYSSAIEGCIGASAPFTLIHERALNLRARIFTSP